MKNLIIADTGYFAALANSKDRFHGLALSVSQSISDDLITTWPVITELCHYLVKNISPEAQAFFLDEISTGVIRVANVERDHLDRVRRLLLKYADLPMDFADASLPFWPKNSATAGFFQQTGATLKPTAGKITNRFKICCCRTTESA